MLTSLKFVPSTIDGDDISIKIVVVNRDHILLWVENPLTEASIPLNSADIDTLISRLKEQQERLKGPKNV